MLTARLLIYLIYFLFCFDNITEKKIHDPTLKLWSLEKTVRRWCFFTFRQFTLWWRKPEQRPAGEARICSHISHQGLEVCSMMNVYICFTDCRHVIVLMCPVQPAEFQSRSKSSIFSLLQCRKHKDYSIFSLLFIIFSWVSWLLSNNSSISESEEQWEKLHRGWVGFD